MDSRQADFLRFALGGAGADALAKAEQRDRRISTLVAPRALLGWVSAVGRFGYSGEVPGVGPVRIEKSERGGYDGSVAVGGEVHSFRGSTAYHVGAVLAVALGLGDADLRSLDGPTAERLGKSVDALVKARIATGHLREAYRSMAAREVADRDRLAKAAFQHTPGWSEHFAKLSAAAKAAKAGGAAAAPTAPIPKPAPVDAAHPPGSKGGFQHTPGWSEHFAKLSAAAKAAKAAAPTPAPKPEAPAQPTVAASPKAIGKTELPGKTAEPKDQLEPEGPEAPQATQPKQVARKPRALSVTKSEADRSCSACGRKSFRSGQFTGCLCFSSLAKGTEARPTKSGYTLLLDPEYWDEDSHRALLSTLKGAQ